VRNLVKTMSTPMSTCPRERDVLDVLTRSAWNDTAHDGLRAHAAGCAVCAEVVEIAQLLREDHDALCRDARVPTAGLVWWRATIRARAEAARVVEQPMTIAQGVGAAAIIGLFVAVAGLVWRAAPALPHPSGLVTLIIAVAVCVVFAPLAFVLALARD
jgi:hypothetical protein